VAETTQRAKAQRTAHESTAFCLVLLARELRPFAWCDHGASAKSTPFALLGNSRLYCKSHPFAFGVVYAQIKIKIKIKIKVKIKVKVKV